MVMKRIVVFGLVVAALWTAQSLWLGTKQPEISSALAVREVNGGALAASELRRFEGLKDGAHLLAGALTLLAAWVCFAPWARRGLQRARRALAQTKFGRFFGGTALPALLLLAVATGCIQPFDRPEYVEIDTSGTGLLLPLESGATPQERVPSRD